MTSTLAPPREPRHVPHPSCSTTTTSNSLPRPISYSSSAGSHRHSRHFTQRLTFCLVPFSSSALRASFSLNSCVWEYECDVPFVSLQPLLQKRGSIPSPRQLQLLPVYDLLDILSLYLDLLVCKLATLCAETLAPLSHAPCLSLTRHPNYTTWRTSSPSPLTTSPPSMDPK